MTLRKYKSKDSKIICSWVKDEKTLFQWSADKIGKFPLLGNELNENYAQRNDEECFFPLTAVDENENVRGHLFALYPHADDKARAHFGFVIVSPEIRGKGYGRKMLELAIEYVQKEFGASKITLGVFENNPKAKSCYESLGFSPVGQRTVTLMGSEWVCIDMELNL